MCLESKKQVYLIHFDRPFRHAKHYLGFTSIGVRNRFNRHLNGDASSLTKAAIQDGVKLVVVRVWNGSRTDERRLKGHSSTRYCPFCKGNVTMGEYLSVKRKTLTYKRDGRCDCKWCGATNSPSKSITKVNMDGEKIVMPIPYKARMYEYAGLGPFCDKECYTSYNGVWPYDAFGPLPVEYERE